MDKRLCLTKKLALVRAWSRRWTPLPGCIFRFFQGRCTPDAHGMHTDDANRAVYLEKPAKK
jgi:hypothetical protein